MCATQASRSDNEGGKTRAAKADRRAGSLGSGARASARRTREVAAKVAGGLRIEPVDNWHLAWPRVLKLIERTGAADQLRVDADGWLSARQVLLVAFIGAPATAIPAAHVCFSVSPSKTGCIEATIDTIGIDPKYLNRAIEAQLHQAAIERAEALGCAKLKGFRASST